MEYTLRSLTADDMFPMFSIISKIGLKEFKDCFDSDEVRDAISRTRDAEGAVSDAEMNKVGMAVAFDIGSIIFNNIGSCKEDIYLFLSGLSGLSKKEIAALPMGTFTRMVVDVIRKEEFKDFFQDVAKLFN